MAADANHPAPSEPAPPVPDPEFAAFWDELCGQSPAEAEKRLATLVPEICAPVLRGWSVRGADLDDLLQEAFVSVLGFARSGGACPRSFRKFLIFRARGVLSGLVRKKQSEANLLSLFVPVDPEGRERRPSDILQTEELWQAFLDCTKRLGEQGRRAVELRIDKGLSPQDTARVLGKTKGAVAVLLHRARESLWGCLVKKGVLT